MIYSMFECDVKALKITSTSQWNIYVCSFLRVKCSFLKIIPTEIYRSLEVENFYFISII